MVFAAHGSSGSSVACLILAAMLSSWAGAAWAGDGLVTVTFAAPLDSGAARAAALVAPAIRDAFTAADGFRVIDLEALLDEVDAPPAAARLTEARRQKDKADLALSMVDLLVAADAYAAALVGFEQGAAGITDIAEVVDAYDKQAITFTLSGESSSAKAAWERALALDPGFRVAADVAPRVKRAFDDVARAWKRPPMGQLTVYATSGAAEVWVDGVLRGAAPLTLDVPAGRHLVRVYREGYRAWGGAVDVKKGAEATVQSSLKPTTGFARLDELVGRLARNPDAPANAVELARFVKSDRMMLVLVQADGPVAALRGLLIDGVSGRVLGRGQKSISVDDEFFARDATSFLRQRFVLESRPDDGGGGGAAAAAVGSLDGEGGARSRLPGDIERVETPGLVIAGWVVTGLAALPIGAGIGLGITTMNQQEAFRSRAQTDADVSEIKSAWLFTAVGADAGYVVGAAMVTAGAVMLVNGYAEQAALQDVIEPGT
ncbi:MAG: PEGA domain-containing protein [Deltaproteobacteria bacterium]|nr:PEGA domain-containing protein [Deltaproteobacteria bacterium]